jgi:hypothetical protein
MLDYKDQRARLAHRGNQDKTPPFRGHKAFRVKQDYKVFKVTLDRRAKLAHRVFRVMTVHRAFKAFKAHPELIQQFPAHRVFKD